jgi:GT2 family glycosyltransferase
MIICIPVYNNLEGLKYAFYSFINSTMVRDKIILLESESTDGSAELCDELAKFYSFVEVIHTKKNGPLKAYNQLFQIAKERKEDMFLTQTDVIFPRKYNCDWLMEMKRIAEERENCGIITCYGGGGHSGPDFIDGFFWVGAWCTYIPYRTIEKLGGYDENIPLGWGVDIDYTYAITQLGYKIYTIDYWVNHIPNYVEGHQHEKVDNVKDLVKEAFVYMRKKWNIK